VRPGAVLAGCCWRCIGAGDRVPAGESTCYAGGGWWHRDGRHGRVWRDCVCFRHVCRAANHWLRSGGGVNRGRGYSACAGRAGQPAHCSASAERDGCAGPDGRAERNRGIKPGGLGQAPSACADRPAVPFAPARPVSTGSSLRCLRPKLASPWAIEPWTLRWVGQSMAARLHAEGLSGRAAQAALERARSEIGPVAGSDGLSQGPDSPGVPCWATADTTTQGCPARWFFSPSR
jgi:hypothetical protein